MKEIERKFLVNDLTIIENCTYVEIKQAYLFNEKEKSLRIRIKNDRAFLTIKGNNSGFTRDEFEYEIPKSDAEEMIGIFQLKVLEKRRYYFVYESFTWEIDVFKGGLEGLCIAEIELPSEDVQFEMPNWIGEEVTFDSNYLNAELIKRL